LFTALAQTFFEKFTGRFPSVEMLEIGKRLWANKLQTISDYQIKYALDQCSKWSQDFAPTLPQFIELCYKAPAQQAEIEHKFTPATDFEKAHFYSDQCRKLLGTKLKYSENNA
jgi:hypothetical protein